MLDILLIALGILIVNLPFGFWRAGVRKFSPAWFFAVHAPVPVAIGLRSLAGVGSRWATLPIFVVAFLLGQYLGGRLRMSRAATRQASLAAHRPGRADP